MNITKIIIICIVTIAILGVATLVTAKINPKMHKTIKLENIIFKRSK